LLQHPVADILCIIVVRRNMSPCNSSRDDQTAIIHYKESRDMKKMDTDFHKLNKRVLKTYGKKFEVSPDALVSAPGRVNLIGEYTDFNRGFVLPMAIDRYLVMALGKREDEIIRVISEDFKEETSVDINALAKKEKHSWGDYISGSIWALKKNGCNVHGFNCVISGNIPVGAGLSSSAALEMAVLRAASWISGIPWNQTEMAKLGQLAENRWVGVNCGIMDQLTSSAGKKGHALLIDCETLSVQPCPVPEISVLVMDTATRRNLVASAYNERRQQCLTAAGKMGLSSLRGADMALLEKNRSCMDADTSNRAEHVIKENIRVLDAVQAMEKNDPRKLGKLIYKSHESLRDCFDVSSPALNDIVECSMEEPACFGARMTGAGFGGCAIALTEKGKEQEFIRNVSLCYEKKTGLEPAIYVCSPSDGVAVKTLKKSLMS